MGRGKRTKLATNIFSDSSGISAIVRHRGSRPRELRFSHGTAMKTIRAEMRKTLAKLISARPQPQRGTLAADAERYYALTRHLASWRERRSEVRAWLSLYGTRNRSQVTADDVQAARTAWLENKVSPKTINHRMHTLRHLYRTLDGQKTETPCDELKPLPVHKTPAVFVEADVIRQVDANLRAGELRGELRSAKTRARFRVLATTGKRPSELMRAAPSDVDLERRVWIVRDGKGGFSPGLYLNDDMLAAWRLFVAAKAWGKYETSAFARTLRSAGWPAGIRPYSLRHTTWITASEKGADLSDVQAGAGHTDIRTTRRHYVPVLQSRMQRLSELLAGRFDLWKDVEPKRGPRRKAKAG